MNIKATTDGNFDEDVLIFSTFYDVNEDNENYSTFAQNLREELGLDMAKFDKDMQDPALDARIEREMNQMKESGILFENL